MGPGERERQRASEPDQRGADLIGFVAPLPPELGFLHARDVGPALLQRTAETARTLGLAPERVLLAEGVMPAERYYRMLARHLALPYAERPLAVAPEATIDDVLHRGILPLAPNPHGWRHLAAPSGPLLRALLQDEARAFVPAGLALTSPDRLEALIRQGRRTAIADEASHGLLAWNTSLSAHGGLSGRQTCWLAGVLAMVSAAAVVDIPACLDLLALIFCVGFLLACGVRIAATAASLAPGSAPAGTRIPDRDLPAYSIVVPLFREAGEVERLTAALLRLDYPRAKLDILLLIEANDRTTLAALERLALPACFRIIMAPTGHPQTKPRALNVALPFALGAFLVVYDAEDDPEPGQLRAALEAFAEAPEVACLQARLAIDNAADSWLTRLFALEYAALFDVVNPGLANLRCPVPLGGTSNHFRTAVLRRVNGWDAWNVTEDIDLGIRLARFGHRVATLASTTFEEAPRTLKAWLAQRRRWQKGWMITLATHSRAPLRTWAELGLGPGLALWAVLFGTVASSLLGPFCFAVLAMRGWSGLLFHPRTDADLAWSLLSGLLLGAGLLGIVWPALLGLRRRRNPRLMLWLPTLPAYFILLSVAAWRAAFEVVGRPYAWSKTEHGRAKRRVAGGTT